MTQLSPGYNKLMVHEVLSVEREKKLGRQARAGSEAARMELVMSNIRFVVHIAYRHLRSGIMLDDLVAAGISGLEAASKGYDPKLGRFPTYARWYITAHIKKHIDEFGMGITRLPRTYAGKVATIAVTRSQLCDEFGRTPTETEIALRLGWKPAFVHELVALTSAVPLDAPTGVDGSGDRHELIEGENPTLGILGLTANSELLEHLMRSLNPKERKILRQRFGFDSRPHTLGEIAETLKITRERVRQIEFGALRKLRAAAKRMPELAGRAPITARAA